MKKNRPIAKKAKKKRTKRYVPKEVRIPSPDDVIFQKIPDALHITPKDERDFKLGSILGHAVLSGLPDEYEVAEPLIIKDQGLGTDTCTAYALTSVCEDEDGVILDPDYSWGVIKQMTKDPSAWGADLRTAAKSAVVHNGAYGLLACNDVQKLRSPQTVDRRNEAAWGGSLNPENILAARQYAKKSYFSVDGPYDFFDNMRSALWQTRNEHRSALSGCNWRKSWTDAPGGIIEQALEERNFGHAVKVCGWRKEYMKLQLSNGDRIGDKGIFWITRDAFNTAFTFGAFTFLDMPKEEAARVVEMSKASHTFFGILSPLCDLFAKMRP